MLNKFNKRKKKKIKHKKKRYAISVCYFSSRPAIRPSIQQGWLMKTLSNVMKNIFLHPHTPLFIKGNQKEIFTKEVLFLENIS